MRNLVTFLNVDLAYLASCFSVKTFFVSRESCSLNHFCSLTTTRKLDIEKRLAEGSIDSDG